MGGDATEEAEEPRYQRGSVLGEGGMGMVYVADDPRLRRQVALKEARGHAQGPAATRLRREARIMAALDHPGIVPVFDMGIGADGRPWYAMRVIRGRTLAAAFAAAETLPDRLRLVRSFLSTCEAVAYAHQRGIVHRDLKPENVLVGPLGEIQVTDWGLARPVGDGGSGWDAVLSGVSTTSVGAVLGTPAYMSPEQAAGDVVDQRADVWSLGVCLYELLVGDRPYSGASAQEVLGRVLTESVPDPSVVRPGVPAELGAIVLKATAREPSERYVDASALAADLEAWLDGRRVSAHRYTAADELGRALARSRRTVLAVGLVGLVAVAVVAWFWQGTLVERDRALDARRALVQASALSDRHLAHALVAQARAAAGRGARREAETLAAHALMLSESPEARGVLMDRTPRALIAASLPLPDDCLTLLLDARGSGSLAPRRSQAPFADRSVNRPPRLPTTDSLRQPTESPIHAEPAQVPVHHFDSPWSGHRRFKTSTASNPSTQSALRAISACSTLRGKARWQSPSFLIL